MITLIKLMILLIIANGAPILVRRIMGTRFNYPVDANKSWFDNRPLLGTSKTWRGIFSSVLLTPLAAALMALPWHIGVVIAVGAMAGDLASSFVKRRLSIAPHDMAIGLDQVPESLLPLLLVAYYLPLTPGEVASMTIAFFIIELLLSKILYRLKIRNRPY